MTPRVVIGQRSNGDQGIFISPPGVNAYTAADSALILTISRKSAQLLLLGQVSSSQTVALGLGSNPLVLITSQNPFSDGTTTVTGPSRPSPTGAYWDGHVLQRGNLASATINSGGASLSITTVGKMFYSVYNEAI